MNIQKDNIRAVVFDAYGTLFDPSSISETLRQFLPGHADAVLRCWRQKQLEYTWLRTLMERYRDFYSLTEEALQFALQQEQQSLPPEAIRELVGAYYELQAFPDAVHALRELSAHYTLAILSNANPSLLERASMHTGLEEWLDAIISADRVKCYKPRPEVYALATAKLGVRADEMLFASSNTWDIAGAASAGLQTAWIRRHPSAMEQLGFQPDMVLDNLQALAQFLAPQ